MPASGIKCGVYVGKVRKCRGKVVAGYSLLGKRWREEGTSHGAARGWRGKAAILSINGLDQIASVG